MNLKKLLLLFAVLFLAGCFYESPFSIYKRSNTHYKSELKGQWLNHDGSQGVRIYLDNKKYLRYYFFNIVNGYSEPIYAEKAGLNVTKIKDVYFVEFYNPLNEKFTLMKYRFPDANHLLLTGLNENFAPIRYARNKSSYKKIIEENVYNKDMYSSESVLLTHAEKEITPKPTKRFSDEQIAAGFLGAIGIGIYTWLTTADCSYCGGTGYDKSGFIDTYCSHCHGTGYFNLDNPSAK